MFTVSDSQSRECHYVLLTNIRRQHLSNVNSLLIYMILLTTPESASSLENTTTTRVNISSYHSMSYEQQCILIRGWNEVMFMASSSRFEHFYLSKMSGR